MGSKKIKLLVASCYDNNRLIEKKVFNVCQYLKRRDLKRLVRELKLYEAEKSIVITLASGIYNKDIFKSYFPDKTLIFKYDTALLVGVKIEYNDNVYNFSLKNILEKEEAFIKHYYD